jgi:hypothetical protein
MMLFTVLAYVAPYYDLTPARRVQVQVYIGEVWVKNNG